MHHTVGWLSSNGNYSSGKPANKLSRFVGALFLSKRLRSAKNKQGGRCRRFVPVSVFNKEPKSNIYISFNGTKK